MKKISSFLIILAGIFWGSQGIFVNQLGKMDLTSMDIAGVRVAGTGVIIFLVILFTKRELLKIKIQDIWIFSGSGLLSIICFNCCYYQAIQMTSMAMAAVLLYISPAVVAVLSCIFLREKVTVRKIFALISAFAGCFFVSGILGREQVVTVMGVMAGIGAGVAYALYSIFSAIGLRKGYQPVTIMTYTFTTGGIGILPLCNIQKIMEKSVQHLNLVLIEIVFVVVSALLPYLLYTIALKYMEAGKASIMASTEAIAATLFGILFLHEKLTVNIILGIIAVVFSIVVLNVKIPVKVKTTKPEIPESTSVN
ncbi:EamA family transporter [Lachnospiraceae bacterium MD308]|nr:EamA family transporter [Lachnospiraceae bacterium MD308]MCI8580395.1 EamA family transporter [Dorea sp.]